MSATKGKRVRGARPILHAVDRLVVTVMDVTSIRRQCRIVERGRTLMKGAALAADAVNATELRRLRRSRQATTCR